MYRNRQNRRIAVVVFLMIIGLCIGFQCVYVSVCISTPNPKDIPYRHTDDFGLYSDEETSGKPLLPLVAIIIDDIGYDKHMAEKLLNLNVPLTFSIFPHVPLSKKFIERIRTRGSEVMLHLPMEPVEYPDTDPGPNAIYSSMSRDELIRTVTRNLDAVPLIKGVNNHMGSRITQMLPHMYGILSILKQRNLFYVDSVTTDDSICQSAARLLRVPFAKRDVFLDHVQEASFIRNQLKLLVQMSQKYGEAVGICHPHAVTYQVLKQELTKLKKQVRLVPVSRVVHIAG